MSVVINPAEAWDHLGRGLGEPSPPSSKRMAAAWSPRVTTATAADELLCTRPRALYAPSPPTLGIPHRGFITLILLWFGEVGNSRRETQLASGREGVWSQDSLSPKVPWLHPAVAPTPEGCG